MSLLMLHRFAVRPGATFSKPLLALGAWLGVGAATFGPTLGAAERDWVVDLWQTDAGLPHNAVNALLQTRDGYLWIGTSNGLARFDGVRFTTFRPADGIGLRSALVRCLFEDSRRTLWVGTEEGGVARFGNGEFVAFTSGDGLSSDTVLCLGEDRAGNLWIGTDSGLNRRTADGLTTFFKTDGLPDDRVHALCRWGDGEPGLLFATAKGLCRFRGETFRVFDANLPAAARSQVQIVHADRTGRLWVGGEAGVFCVVTSATPETPSQSVQVIGEATLALTERANGEVWIGTAAGALYRVRVASGGAAPAAPQAALEWRTSRPITALLEDREGNLWVGTAGGGLYRLKPRQLRLVPLPSTGEQPPRFFETPQGDIGFLGSDQGLYRLEDDRFVRVAELSLPEAAAVESVEVGAARECWVGTRRHGLFEFDARLWRGKRDGARAEPLRQYGERDGLSDNAIAALYAEAGGGLWIGTRNGGLNYLKGDALRRFHTPWGYFGTYAAALEMDAAGALWIGTSGDGLFRFANGRFESFDTASGLPALQIHAAHADADGALWVGTARGLCRVKRGRVTAFGPGSGLAEDAVFQVQSDADGNLWVGTLNGIYRVPKAQANAYAEGRAPFVTAVHYGREDGLPMFQCVPPGGSVKSRAGRNRVWFATTRGVVVTEPGAAVWNQTPPPVVVESVFVDNVSVPFDDGVRVPPGRESVRFNFTALSLTAPGKVQFRYRLEGLDRDWSEPTGSRTVRYPKVPPGRYRFQVIACNNDGVWNTEGASVAVVVGAFWWETLWFRLGVALAGAGGLLGVYAARRARRRQMERLRVRIARDLHDEIGSSLWSITLLTRVLIKDGQLAPQARQDVDEIARIANQTSNAIRDIIWLINPSFDTMHDLLLRTKDFAATALRGVEYRLHCAEAALTRKLPLDLRQNLFLFFKEALTNVARHARATVVEVRIELHGSRWRIAIRDNGVGFDPENTVTGNGLRNLRARAARMGATVDIQSRPGQGTTLTLTTAPIAVRRLARLWFWKQE
jgi:ligand-binding sensor domain-containing protein/anti-sigma regulatory factor (Ser/Thr protein kinase)